MEPPGSLVLNYGRNIRNKIPSIMDLACELADEEDQYILRKGKGEEAEDRARNDRESNIEVEDKVMVKNVFFPNKLTTPFNENFFEVVQKTGSKLVLQGEGRIIRRHLS